MVKQFLNGNWTMVQKGADESIEGTIPGSVYSFLLEAGKMGDPFYRDNEERALRLMEHDYVFSRDFDLSDDFACCKEIFLHFSGIDTLSYITLNGRRIGSTDNMFRSWEFPVGKYLKKHNHLSVTVQSPLKYIKQADSKFHVGGSSDCSRGYPHLRKAHCMFGWDWGARLPDGGIWKDVCLLGTTGSRILDCHIVQRHQSGQVFVKVDVLQSKHADVAIQLINPHGNLQIMVNHQFVKVDNPELWWPNGLGDQPLYLVSIRLIEQGVEIDSMVKRIGLRTMKLDRRKDKWGERFAHRVNDVDFFAMGADYIPEDNLLSRITPERTQRLLEQCKAAHFNCIRVWGGGVYPQDWFYDICDELGLVVWQDMMFACSNYELNDNFEQNITQEIDENVRRIRHHASLGLWCGNNEIEEFEITGKYDSDDHTRATYIKMYEYLIPHILKEADPDTPYWPSSPSSGGSFDNPTDSCRGDVHYWEVWHGGVPFSAYREFRFRYVSEFGFQSFPDMRTIASFTKPEDRNIFSRIMDKHQRNSSANGRIMMYMAQTFLYPTSLDMLVYASQLLQAEAIKYGVEHWRRNRGICMGAIYWQLDDIWPVASWSSIDYYGRWKALHYFAKRFFAPVIISCEETGEQTVLANVNQEHDGPIPTKGKLCVANETRIAVTGVVKWALCNEASVIIASGMEIVTVPALSSLWLKELDFHHTDFLHNHLSFAFEVNGKIVSSGSILFTQPKYYGFINPHLSYEISGNKIRVHADAYAKYVAIDSPDTDILLSDNYFDMEKGEREVLIESGNPKVLKIRSCFNIK